MPELTGYVMVALLTMIYLALNDVRNKLGDMEMKSDE